MNNKLRILGSLSDSFKRGIAAEFSQRFIERYPSVEGEMYLQYTIRDIMMNKQGVKYV